MAKKSAKPKETPPIRSMAELKREKAKAYERLSYTQSLLEEDWQSLQDQLKPSAMLGSIDRLLPLISNLGPVQRIAGRLFRSFFSKDQKAEAEPDERSDNANSRSAATEPGFGKRVRRTLYRALIPFAIGTALTTAIFRRNQ